MRLTLIISLIISIFAVIFALQNPQPTEVQIGRSTLQESTALVLLVTFALGVLVGILGALPGWIRNRRKVTSLRKALADERVESTKRRETQQTVTERTTETPPASTETNPPAETGRTTTPRSETDEEQDRTK